MKTGSVARICAVFALLCSSSVLAQDPALVNPSTVQVKLDNDQVRVLEAVLKPGDKEQMHSHPAAVMYILSGGRIRNHTADGKSVESDLTAGQTVFREPVTHWAENIGTTTVHLILVELKTAH